MFPMVCCLMTTCHLVQPTVSIHTTQDVPIWTHSSGSEHFGGSIENIQTLFSMANALALNPRGE